MPLLTGAGQAEAHVNAQLSGRLETQAAYSPVAHIMLTGAGTVGLNPGYLRTRQAELGVGGYWPLGQTGLWSVQVGGGSGATRRQTCFLGCDDLQARTGKIFGQAGVAWDMPAGWLGFTYRLARVRYTQVSIDEVAIPVFSTLRHELLFFQRRPLLGSTQWFTQSTIGISCSSLSAPSRISGASASQRRDDQWFAAGILTPVFSLGIGWQPGR